MISCVVIVINRFIVYISLFYYQESRDIPKLLIVINKFIVSQENDANEKKR